MALTPWLSHFKTDFELARRRRGESIAFDALRCEAFDRFLLLGCSRRDEFEFHSGDDDEAWTCVADATGVLAPRVLRFGVSMNF